jgi:thiol-disulfide isomerase/thioredoxin
MLRRVLCVLVGLLTALTFGQPLLAKSSGAEKPAALTLRDTQGAKVKLSDLRGRIVVLNFWATWCGPCNAEMPMLVKAAESYSGKGVIFIGASADAPETQGKIPSYVQKLQITYPIWIGATDMDMKRLEMGDAVPGTAFLDAEGVVRARILGQMRPGEIEERLDWLLRDRQGTAPAELVKHLDEK